MNSASIVDMVDFNTITM